MATPKTVSPWQAKKNAEEAVKKTTTSQAKDATYNPYAESSGQPGGNSQPTGTRYAASSGQSYAGDGPIRPLGIVYRPTPTITVTPATPATPTTTTTTTDNPTTTSSGSSGGSSKKRKKSSVSTPEPLAELVWPGPDAVPAQLRDWMSWFRDIYTANQATGALPYMFEGLENTDLEETGKTLALRELMNNLAINSGKNLNSQNRWQMFVNSLPLASLKAQQALVGLNYDADTGWTFKDVPALYNPAYL